MSSEQARLVLIVSVLLLCASASHAADIPAVVDTILGKYQERRCSMGRNDKASRNIHFLDSCDDLLVLDVHFDGS